MTSWRRWGILLLVLQPGARNGRWTTTVSGPWRRVLAQCDCGTVQIHWKTSLSCGCLNREVVRASKARAAEMGKSARFWARVSKAAGCWLFNGSPDAGGYMNFFMDGRTIRSHRVAWMLERGPIPEGMSVLHSCDVRACVRPDHLFLGTQLDNIRDAKAKGRLANNAWAISGRRGDQSARSKLSEDEVRTIKALMALGIGNKPLSIRFDVDACTISAIRTGRNWAWL